MGALVNRDVFAADRSGRLERFDRYLMPYVERALAHYGEAGWYEPIVREATALWEGMYRGEEAPADIAEFQKTLRESLKETTPPEESSAGQVERVTKWVGTYTANHAEHTTGKNTDVPMKEWVTRHDDRVRALHREVDGQTVPSGEKFDVGGYHLRFPGDPVGPPEVWINCRCLLMKVEGSMTAAAPEVTEVPFHGIAAPTDTPSGDGRQLARAGFSHRDLPMPLNYQRGSSHGGDSGPAYTIGRIDAMGLNEEGMVEFSGIISTAFPEAVEAIQHLKTGSMNGVSVDVDSAKEQYQELPSPADFASEAEFVEAMQSITQVFSSWRISGVTMCSIPAFAEAFIALADQAAPEPALAASVWTFNLVASSSEPLPAEWFRDPGLSGPTPFTVLDNGQVFGHIATWGVCHVGMQDRCTTAPHSATGYAYYRTGVVATTAGDIPVGQITMGAGHADLKAGAQAAAAHYDNTAFAVADVAAGEDIHGIWVAGALRPSVNEQQRYALKAAALSGDWRNIRGNLELVAALAVNTPGFPIPRIGLAASGADQTSLVAAGIVAGPETIVMADAPTDAAPAPAPDAAPEPMVDTSAERIAKDLRAVDAAIDTVVAFLNGFGDSLPPEAQQARDLAVAADDVIDQLMRDLGIPDPEDEAGQPGEPLTPGVVASAELRAAVAAELARRDRVERLVQQRLAVRTIRVQRVRARTITKD